MRITSLDIYNNTERIAVSFCRGILFFAFTTATSGCLFDLPCPPPFFFHIHTLPCMLTLYPRISGKTKQNKTKKDRRMDTNALNFRFQLLKDSGTCDGLLLQVISLLVAHVNDNHSIMSHALTTSPMQMQVSGGFSTAASGLPCGGGPVVHAPPASSSSGAVGPSTSHTEEKTKPKQRTKSNRNNKNDNAAEAVHRSRCDPSTSPPSPPPLPPPSISSSSSCGSFSPPSSTAVPSRDDLVARVPFMAESMRILQEHLVLTTESCLQQYAADVGRVNDLGIAALEAQAQQWQEAVVDHVSQRVDAVLEGATSSMKETLEKRQSACLEAAAAEVGRLEQRLEDLQAACREHERQLEAYAGFVSSAYDSLLTTPLLSAHHLLTTSVFLEEEITCLAESAATRVQVDLLEERVQQLEGGKRLCDDWPSRGQNPPGQTQTMTSTVPNRSVVVGAGGSAGRHAGNDESRRGTLTRNEIPTPASRPRADPFDSQRDRDHYDAEVSRSRGRTDTATAAPQERNRHVLHENSDEESFIDGEEEEEEEEEGESESSFAITATRPRKYL